MNLYDSLHVQYKSNKIMLQKFVVMDSVVWCSVITAWYKNIVKSQKYLQASQPVATQVCNSL